MAGMAELSYSMEMRDVIAGLVREQLNKERPRYRYATVISIDRANYKCTIKYNGETSNVVVNMGSIQPIAAGQFVRVEGIGIDKFITDVVGGGQISPVPTPVATTDPTPKSYVDTVLSGTIGTPQTGWTYWSDAAYKNLMFTLTRQNMVFVSGLIKFVSGASLKMVAISGAYIPWTSSNVAEGRYEILNGAVQETPRLITAQSDGLYLRGAVPTANQWVSVNGWYPGRDWTGGGTTP